MIQHAIQSRLCIRDIIWRLVRCASDREEGQDMMEYALLAALISVVTIVIIIAMGPSIQGFYQSVVDTLTSV